MARFDVKLNNNEPVAYNGDFVLAESDTQHIEDTIRAFPGNWKQFPTEGVGIGAYQNSPMENQALAKNIRLQLTADGYNVGNPIIQSDSSGNVIINPDATYNG
jgi:hypothetical protein